MIRDSQLLPQADQPASTPPQTPQQVWDDIVDRMMACPDSQIKQYLTDTLGTIRESKELQKAVNMDRGLVAFYNRFQKVQDPAAWDENCWLLVDHCVAELSNPGKLEIDGQAASSTAAAGTGDSSKEKRSFLDFSTWRCAAPSDWDTSTYICWGFGMVIWCGALITATIFTFQLLFTDKIGYKAVCATIPDARDNVCFFSVGQITWGIVAVGQVAIGIFTIGQAAVGLASAWGQGTATFGHTGGQICFGFHVHFSQVSVGLYKSEYSQMGLSLLDPFYSGGKLVAQCGD